LKLYLCTHCGRKIPRAELLEHRKTCSPDAEFKTQEGVLGHLRAFLKTLGVFLGALLLAALSLFLGNMSFVRLTEMRQLERIPASSIIALLPGEVNLSGQVQFFGRLLSSPQTSTPCVYYRHLVEREEKDSDGDTRWVTVSDEQKFVPFLLQDDTGMVPVIPDTSVDFNVPESFQEEEGNMRYTEYRIDPGASLFAFGMAVANLEGMELRFDAQGHYKPILSLYGETSERVRMAGGSIAFCWGGLVVMAFALALLVSIFRMHQLLSYFALLNTVVAVYLVVLGLNMMKQDLHAARERLLRHESSAREALLSQLPSWDGQWATLPEDDAPLFQNLRPELRTRVSLIRIQLARAVERARRQRNAFPERVLAPLWGIPAIDPLPLPPFVRVQVDADRLRFEKAKVPPLLGWGLIGASLLVGALCYRAGFRRVRFKRCMENLPTSLSVGVAYGLSELKGVVEAAPESDALRAPLSQQPCVQYHYTIRERTGSGKKARWVTVLDENRSCLFLCRDAEGALPIQPQGAVLHTHHHSSRNEGSRVYHETRLEIGDPLYAIGEAVIDPRRGDRLLLAKPGNDFPFILSNFTERRIYLLLAFRGILLLNVSFAAILLSALLLFGLSGSYAATDYLSAALVAPFFMTLVTLSLHYNDLVFLRERVRRNRANIDVALKKRHDLLPMLEEVTHAMQGHERELQTELSQMRSLYADAGTGDEPAIAETLGQMVLRAEAYPDLRSQPLFAELMRTMIVLENELAFTRKGHNDAVETYNTRIQILPDLIFAKLFHFRAESFCEGGGDVIRVPPLIRDIWETAQLPQPPPTPLEAAEETPDM
jgi:hypothetical protein